MSNVNTTIVAAAIAVIGTLMSPILVQYMNSRSKAQEYDLARKQRSEERQAEAELRKYEELRDEYTELNAKVRDYVKALSDYLHLIRAQKCDEEARMPLEKSRTEYLQCYSDAQMRLPDAVLGVAIKVNTQLSRLYGMALRLDGFTVPARAVEVLSASGQKETIESAFTYLESSLRPAVWELRNTMRIELGVGKADL